MKSKLAILPLMCFWIVIPTYAQEACKYAKNGIAFDYVDGWKLTEKPGKDTDEVSLSNADADAQITLITVKKEFKTNNPVDIRKQIADPWIKSLTTMYATQKIHLIPKSAPTEVGGNFADGMKFEFTLDEQLGTIESYWTVLDKKAVLVYMIRPDRTAAKAAVGWDLVRKTLAAAVTK